MRAVIVAVGDLDTGHVLTPPRYEHAAAQGDDGIPLGDLVTAAREAVRPAAAPPGEDLVVLDTTHARDGILDFARARAGTTRVGSVKRRVLAGDVLISRLRPYLRQVAYVDDAAAAGRSLCCSTEFYVLRSRGGESIAYLAAWLLSAPVQAALENAQEGGHHPRVNEETLLRMTVPRAVHARRDELSAAVEAAAAASRESRRLLDAAAATVAAAVKVQ